MKPKLLLIYDYFYPAYKAGGPVQSLVNMARSLQDFYDISVITGAGDLNDSSMLKGITPDAWNKVKLPGAEQSVAVWYASAGKLQKAKLRELFAEIKPSIIYINGIFSLDFVVRPLQAAGHIKTVVCPRGMLQRGALQGKRFKKKAYLAAVKLAGVFSNTSWHATNQEEKEDIQKQFGANARISVAENIPKPPLQYVKPANKSAGKLRLIYLSLISEKKNLLQAIELVAASGKNVTLDIYGPVKDKTYWDACEQKINSAPGNIRYHGDVIPELVQSKFEEHDALILLTKGENFGHALYECFSAGRPVITSFYTPWNDLEKKQAGWNVDINESAQIRKTLEQVRDMNSEDFNAYCSNAHALASSYFQRSGDANVYRSMFRAD